MDERKLRNRLVDDKLVELLYEELVRHHHPLDSGKNFSGLKYLEFASPLVGMPYVSEPPFCNVPVPTRYTLFKWDKNSRQYLKPKYIFNNRKTEEKKIHKLKSDSWENFKYGFGLSNILMRSLGANPHIMNTMKNSKVEFSIL